MRRNDHRQQRCKAGKALATVFLAVFFSALLMGAGLGRTRLGFEFPLADTAYRVSDRYGQRADPFTGKTAFHAGVDLACAQGTVVLAVEDGVVVTAKNGTSYGNYLRICHADDTVTVYAHLQYLYVRAGEVVRRGQVLGTVGQTGRATGAHLHFELYRQGERCDPAPALGLSDEA